MANMHIRVDDTLKKQAQSVSQSLGLDLSSAVRMFLTQMVKENRLPFQPVVDPFYSEENIKRLKKSIAQMEATGGTVHKVILDD